jgi:hypothetical protein
MNPAEPNRSLPLFPAPTARGISQAGMVLFALYLAIVAGALFPLLPLDPAWHLRLGTSLINAAPFPLLGLVLVHLAAGLAPSERLLQTHRRQIAFLASGAALGFLLLAPLMAVSAIQQVRHTSQGRAEQINRAERQLRGLRQAVAEARSSRELQSRLQALRGPVVEGGEERLPLPVLQDRVKASLAAAQLRLEREREPSPVESPWRLVPELLRNTFACLALALGFAGLARRRKVPISLLQEVQRWAGKRLRFLRMKGR